MFKYLIKLIYYFVKKGQIQFTFHKMMRKSFKPCQLHFVFMNFAIEVFIQLCDYTVQYMYITKQFGDLNIMMCDCNLSAVIRGRVRFPLSHGNQSDTETVLEHLPRVSSANPRDNLSTPSYCLSENT